MAGFWRWWMNLLGVQGVGGSNPPIPTIYPNEYAVFLGWLRRQHFAVAFRVQEARL